MRTVVSAESRIDHVEVTDETITAYLVDGRVISVPLAWYWRLSDATPAQRANWTLIGDGHGVHWPDVDEDLSVDGMLNGVPARLGPEAKYGLGVIIRPTPLGISYGHSGFLPGYVTEMMYFPESKIAIAVQVNTSVPRVTRKPLTGFITDFAGIIMQEQTSR